MTTRRSFLQKLSLIAWAATVGESKILLAQVRRRIFQSSQSTRSAAVIYVSLSEKNRLDYSYKKIVETTKEAGAAIQVCTKGTHNKLRLRRSKVRNSRRSHAAAARAHQESGPGEGDYFVLSAVVTTNIKGLKQALPSLKTVTSKASKTKQQLKELLYHELSRLRPNYRSGLEVNEVYLEKARITAHYKTRCGAVNRNRLYARMMEVLLESCDLARFNEVLVCPDVKVIRNVSKKGLRKYFRKHPNKAPRRRFEIHPLIRQNHDGLQIASFVNHALLQGHQPYPLPDQNGQWLDLIKKYVRKRLDAASLL